MANVVANVTAGKPKVTGAVYRAALGSTLPTDATSNLDAAFKAVGYLSDDGITWARDLNTSVINAYGGDPVLTTQESKTTTCAFTMIEALNIEAMKTAFGSSNVTGALATGITVEDKSTEPEAACYVIENALRDGAVERHVIPNGIVTDLDDITYTDADPVGYGVTITCLADASGVAVYDYKVRA